MQRAGDEVFLWLLGGATGAFAVVLAYFLPVPTALIYAAVGDGGMRLRTFLVLDALGTVLWTSALAVGGYVLGRRAVDVADAFAHYALWVSIAGVIVIAAWSTVRRARG